MSRPSTMFMVFYKRQGSSTQRLNKSFHFPLFANTFAKNYFYLINYLLYVLDKKDKYLKRNFSRKYENKQNSVSTLVHWSCSVYSSMGGSLKSMMRRCWSWSRSCRSARGLGEGRRHSTLGSLIDSLTRFSNYDFILK